MPKCRTQIVRGTIKIANTTMKTVLSITKIVFITTIIALLIYLVLTLSMTTKETESDTKRPRNKASRTIMTTMVIEKDIQQNES